MKRTEQPTEFTTFDEMVGALALNTPHALVLDWWRRLERAIDDYFKARRLPRPAAIEAEKTIAGDPELGPAVADEVRQLCQIRNAIAHEEPQPIGRDEAASYAAKCLDLIWRIAADAKEQTADRDKGERAV